MAARSIASLTLSFALVSIPVRLYSATESSASVRFNLLTPEGKRVKQQYVADDDPTHVVPRGSLVKGYEFEKDRYVLFSSDELKQLEDSADPAIEIIAFIPAESIDPLYYDKAYLLAPDRRGGKPYALLREAMLQSGRCALARWTWKSRQSVVQVRPHAEGLILQQLLYADEVRSPADLDIEQVDIAPAELKLALQLIEQISQDDYDPTQYRDEERARILAAIDRKIAGQQVVATTPADHGEPPTGAQIIDLMQALRDSLGKAPRDAKGPTARRPAAKGTGTPATTPAVSAPASLRTAKGGATGKAKAKVNVGTSDADKVETARNGLADIKAAPPATARKSAKRVAATVESQQAGNATPKERSRRRSG